MKMKDIIDTIRELSYSQGFYGRLLRYIMELQNNDYEAFENLKDELEAKNFKNALDLVLYLEC